MQRCRAGTVGARINEMLRADDAVALHVSPFERTLETARHVRQSLHRRQVRFVHIEPLIREQEFGNLQGEGFADCRKEQQRIGRFFYRFPTGESGSDVYGRTKLWWTTSILPINERPGYDAVDVLIVVTHGLTMRLILMQLFGWSPNTFGSVWNADNCACYVLNKDLSQPGTSPYVLDEISGDRVQSSIALLVHFVDGTQCELKLEDYLSIPSPRSRHEHVAKEMLAKQHALDPQTIKRIDFFGGRSGYSSQAPKRSPAREAHDELGRAALESPLAGQEAGAQEPGITRRRY